MKGKSKRTVVEIAAAVLLVQSCIVAAENSPATVKFSKRKLLVSPYESCAVADINRDGHLDIVYGAYWFAGPDWLPHAIRPNHTSAEYMRTNSDHIYDVDKRRLARRHRRRLERGRHLLVQEPGQRPGRARRAVGNALAVGVAPAGQDRRQHGDVRPARLRRRWRAGAAFGLLPQGAAAGSVAVRQG